MMMMMMMIMVTMVTITMRMMADVILAFYYILFYLSMT